MTDKKRAPIADYVCTVVLKGHRKGSLEDAYNKSAPWSRKHINKRTGKPWTVYGPLQGPTGQYHVWTAQFELWREGIRGNQPNDIIEFIDNQIINRKDGTSRRITTEIKYPKRTVWVDQTDVYDNPSV